MGIADYIARVFPLTLGGTAGGPAGIPAYRLPFLSAANPSEALATMAQQTTKTYSVNPYIGDPIHAYDVQG